MIFHNSFRGKLHAANLIHSLIKGIVIYFICFLFSSCSHIYYSPNSSNVPLFKEKGEARINAYYSGGEEIEGLELQSALAVGKNIGIMLNTAFLGSGEDGSGFLIEGGAGYYKPISEKIVFETYGGFGFGNAVNNYQGGGNSKVSFTKCFIQPSIGFTSKYFDFGVASKISGVFMKLSSENGLIEYYDLMDLDFINSNPNSFLWEPSIFIRFGFQGIKAQLQATASENMNNEELVQEVVNISFGISINIQPRQNKRS